MGDFIGQLRARQAQINAEIGQHLSAIAALSNEMSDIAAAGRVFAGIVSTKTNTPGGEFGTAREAPGDKRTEQSEMRGLEEGLEAAPRTIPDAADTSGTMSDVSAAMTSLLGDTDAASDSHATGKPGAASSEAAPAPSLLSRVRAYMVDHPDATVRECADALGEEPIKVRNTGRRVVVFGATRSAHKTTQSRQEADEADDASSAPADEFADPEQDDEEVEAFVPPRGEMAERTEKRREVAVLHRREPWLSPEAAATRLAIPVVNLRIFSQELEIAWSQPRPSVEPAPALPEAAPKTLREKVRAIYAMHPTWTPRLIADQLGANVDSVTTYLSEARKLAAAAQPAHSVRVVGVVA
jgi:DNA-directed RNA polymerase specialized sigma24 family protein